MTDPISFSSTSTRFGLPFLFAAQAQKEFFVNEALARIDALLHAAVEGEASNPPANPPDGECWIVGPAAVSEWAGHDGELACRQEGTWLFIAPQDGLSVFDKSAGQLTRYDGTWQGAATVTAPSGGSTEDAEARIAIGELIAALQLAGILAQP